MGVIERYPRGCLFLAVAVAGSLSWLLAGTGWSIVLLALLLLGPAIEDARSGYISDGWSLLLAVSGIVTSWQVGHGMESLASVIFLLALYGLLYVIKKDAAGMGDVILSAAVSLWLTPVFALLFLWLASVLALSWYGLVFLYERNTNRKGIRFAPFLALGGGIAYGLQETVGLSLFTALWLFAG